MLRIKFYPKENTTLRLTTQPYRTQPYGILLTTQPYRTQPYGILLTTQPYRTQPYGILLTTQPYRTQPYGILLTTQSYRTQPYGILLTTQPCSNLTERNLTAYCLNRNLTATLQNATLRHTVYSLTLQQPYTFCYYLGFQYCNCSSYWRTCIKEELSFTMRTEQLAKCSESLRKLRARLGSCYTGLSSQVIFYTTGRSKQVLLRWFSVFASFGVSFCTVSPSVCLDDITKTSPCNKHPLKPHFYIVKLGFTGVYFFLIFAPKHRLWVLVRTASVRRF